MEYLESRKVEKYICVMKTLKIKDTIHRDVRMAVAKSTDEETIQEFVEYAILAELHNRKKMNTTKSTKAAKKCNQ